MGKMYTFKPFVFMNHKAKSCEKPKARSGHRIVCDEYNLYSYGGFNPSITNDDPDMQNDHTWTESRPLFKELWKFSLATQQWKRLPGRERMPNELASNAVVLKGNTLLVYGGTGVPFGESCSNQLYSCNINDGEMLIVNATGDFPEPQYGQAVICDGPFLYTVGGTSGYEYTCDIHRFDLRTKLWEAVYICAGRDPHEPKGRYRHELAFDGKRIYVLGGGTAMEAYGFVEIPAYDLKTNRWMTLNTLGDPNSRNDNDQSTNEVPRPRRCHGSVQYTDENTGVTTVVISGGYNGSQVFNDIWKLDLKLLQWTRLNQCKLPRPVYFHSTALTPVGRMYAFGGIIRKRDEAERTDAVLSVWLTIPKLSEICWEAINYYYPNLQYHTTDDLLRVGIPMKYVRRLDNDCNTHIERQSDWVKF